MQTILIILASLVLTGIIISPFFWLKFLREKSVRAYLTTSSFFTLFFFILANTFFYDFTLKYINSYDALAYFDAISMNSIYMIVFMIIISPFIFTKIINNSINVRNFFISLLLSCLISISIFLFWVYVLLPKAFGDLLKNL